MKYQYLAFPAFIWLLMACGAASQQPIQGADTVATVELTSKKPANTPGASVPEITFTKTTKPVPQSPNTDMLRVKDDQIVDGSGNVVRLQGVAFGNRVWIDEELPYTHHNELDYQRLADMKMNAVRFYMNYKTFEDDAAPGKYKDTGWKWLDDNIAWAKRHGIYLIPNMHVPQGGYQSLGKGKALWDDDTAQKRLIDLWTAMAERYRDEPTIAGWDFVNEPIVSKSRDQWHTLADKLVTAVRKVDPYHIFIIERVNAVDGDWKEDDVRNFFLVDDPNVVYEFHFYKPFHFTHQGAPWAEFAAENTSWPDESRVGVEWFYMNWETGTFSSPTLPEGNSDWAYYEGATFVAMGKNAQLAKPALTCAHNSGKAYFDDVVIEQIDQSGNVEKVLRQVNLTTTRGWYFWNPSEKGEAKRETTGHNDDASLSISGTVGDSNLGADVYQIKMEQGKRYRISGWMKGEQIPAGARCMIRLDVNSASVPLHGWDKGFLEQEMNAYLAFGKKYTVPLFLGEFGAITASFEENRGGEKWVADMMDIILKNDLHFTYHSYHENAFGMYLGDEGLPDEANANDALIDVLRDKLNK
ncbi:MAG: cellulase family glycosylhydrolase [Deltaproteobacteria bacterium]|nr:cellulase family glycosylhydrolase [Deltaproteobacteria bacterium]